MHKMKDMPYHMGLQCKLYLSNRNKYLVALNDGASRYVYNHLVATGNEIYRLKQSAFCSSWAAERIDYLESARDGSRGIKNSAPFLYGDEIDSSAVDNAITNYKAAWKNMKERHTGVPTFHKKSECQSYQTSNHYTGKSTHMNDGSIYFMGNKHIRLPLLGKVRIGVSKKLLKALFEHADLYETRIGTVTISRDAVGEYWVSIQVASMHPFKEELPKTGSIIGIDLNLENFLTDSNNCVIDNPRYLKNTEPLIKKQQRILSRKAEHAKKEKRPLCESKNYQKQRKKLAYTQRKVARQRAEFHHILAKDMVESQDLIVAEDLKVRNLKKNHKLAKAISDAGWRSFLTILGQKASTYGKELALIDPRNTTQTCSNCGYKLTDDEKLTLSDREWTCPSCGTHHLRDHNAALNILNRYLATTADKM